MFSKFHISARLGNMRKPADWIVYPASRGGADGKLLIQSDTRIAEIDVATKKARLSPAKSSGAYFIHLVMPGVTTVDVPQDVIDAALAAQPKSGDTLGNGVVQIA